MGKKKEDRSNWVAVSSDVNPQTSVDPPIRPASTPYQIFQRDMSSFVRRDLQLSHQPTDVGTITRTVSTRWKSLNAEGRERYEVLARQDKDRFLRESHERDCLQRERQERLRRERDEIFWEDPSTGGDAGGRGRTTRGSRAAHAAAAAAAAAAPRSSSSRSRKAKHKSKRRHNMSDSESSFEEDDDDDDDDDDYDARPKRPKSNHKRKAANNDDDESEEEYQEESSSDGESHSFPSDSDSDSEDNHHHRNKKKSKHLSITPPPPPISAVSAPPKKPLTERQKQNQATRLEKQAFLEQRQDELKVEKAEQAKRRLDFLLKQSDIFRHFGSVKEDQGKLTKTRSSSSRNNNNNNNSLDKNISSHRNHHENDMDSQEEDILEEDENSENGEHSSSKAVFLTSQPSTLGPGKGKMRPYQLEGLNWMAGLQDHGVNGILADEMGLGKTLQSISVLVYMKEYQQSEGPHLIVVPKSTLSNWMNELRNWAPTLKAIRFHGTKEERDIMVKTELMPGLGPMDEKARDWNVCVTTYEVCNIDKNVLNKFAWSYLIIDEAHRLKNEASAFSKTIRNFETKYRLLLTGTPLQNNLHELWALLNFLVPDVFASAEQFDDWFNLDIDDAETKNNLISQLHKILRPFMLRRLKADVEKTLPPKHETILYTGMSVMQKKLYKDILLRDVDLLSSTGKSSGGGSGGGGNRTAILNIVMQLRKCAGHPYLFPGVEDRSLPPLGEHLVENCGKMVLLDKLLKRLHERGHRVLLFTQMTRIIDILEDYMVMRGFQYCRIDGNTSYDIREESIDVFNQPNSSKFLFLLSTRAGGLGINLQTADVVILYDSDWNPQADLQAQDRAHRIGQKKPVQVFRLVTEHTIEEKVVERAQQKLKLDAMVVQQGRLKDKDKLSREELLDAVRFGADRVFKSKDSSITDDDIDMILDQGRKKTQELNEKLQIAEKGDMLDFKLDGSTLSTQTFEGIDYSQKGKDLAQIKAAQAQAELMGILDIGKRERRTVANYNENQLFRQQVAAPAREKKKKEIRLPKYLRLPRLEEWQMFDREALQALQDEEEAAFRALTPEQLKPLSSSSPTEEVENEGDGAEAKAEHTDGIEEDPTKAAQTTKSKHTIDFNALPPLLSEEKQNKKKELLAEGFSDWQRQHYMTFIRASAKYGRSNYTKIAEEVGKPLSLVKDYAESFWDENMGKKRISENEYEKVVKNIERGEKKLAEIKGLERGTAVLVSLFDNPWFELEFTHVNCKDKLYTLQEDRHLLCWAHKYGYGQWGAIKMAIRRSHTFRFDYFFKSLPPEALGRRCESLMRAAEREVEQLEKEAREEAGIQVDEDVKDGNKSNTVSATPIKLPTFKEIQAKKRIKAEEEYEKDEHRLEQAVEEIENQMEQIQNRLKLLNEYSKDTSNSMFSSTGEFPDELLPDLVNLVAKSGPTGILAIASEFADTHSGRVSKRQTSMKIDEIAKKEKRVDEGDTRQVWYIQDEYKHLLDVDTLRFLRKGKSERHYKKDHHDNNNDRKRKISHHHSSSSRENQSPDAMGPDGEYMPFPEYDGIEEPKENKKAFTHFCNGTRREVKHSLDPVSRKDKQKVNKILKKRWYSLSDKEKVVWKKWEEWDRKRYALHLSIFEKKQGQQQHQEPQKVPKKENEADETNSSILNDDEMHIPKRKISPVKNSSMDFASIPKKRR